MDLVATYIEGIAHTVWSLNNLIDPKVKRRHLRSLGCVSQKHLGTGIIDFPYDSHWVFYHVICYKINFKQTLNLISQFMVMN